MSSTRNIHDRRLADAWATLQAHSNAGLPLEPDAARLAFADPEFLLRRETRGIRFQLELLKPDLEQQAHGIENTIVVFGSARLRDDATSAALSQNAESGGDEALARRARALQRNAHYYEKARAFGRIVAEYSAGKEPRDMLFVAYNPSSEPMTAQAIPSVSPSKAAAFFHKTECFCFTQQVLQPGERIEMPVRFIVDRDLPDDVKHLTLGYTLFDITARKPPVAQAP